MKKLLIVCSFTTMAISGLFYACKKDNYSTPVVQTMPLSEQNNAQTESSFTVEKFERRLNLKLNKEVIAAKGPAQRENLIHFLTVQSEVNDLKLEITADGKGKISQEELERVYLKVKNDVEAAAAEKYLPEKGLVVLFAMGESITIPEAAIGTIKEVAIKVNGLVATKGDNKKPAAYCSPFSAQNFDQPTTEGWGMAEAHIESALNSKECNPDLKLMPQNCIIGNAELIKDNPIYDGYINVSGELIAEHLSNGKFGSTTKTPLYPIWSHQSNSNIWADFGEYIMSKADQDIAFQNAIDFVNNANNAMFCGCSGKPRKIYFYDVVSYYYDDETPKRGARYLTVNGYHVCCQTNCE